jgi:trigger factor
MKDGEPYFFKGGDNTASAQPSALEIGSGGFIPGFEYNLIGKNPADYTEDNPIVVETFFPEKYQSAELAGKTAYFIVTVKNLVEYDAPELNDAFVAESLKLTEGDLSAYKGESLSEKYLSYVREQVLKEKGFNIDNIIMDAFWKAVIDNAVVKKYPEKQLKETYDTFIEELEYYYGFYSLYYGYEYNTFMCVYLGLEEGSDWKAHVEQLAKARVKEQLIFYHIMNQEGFKPTAEEYDALFEIYLTDALKSKGITPDKYQTQEGYETAKEDYKNQLLKTNGDDYFKSMIYYKTTVDGIKSLANIIEIGV